jgi:CHAT domain
MDAVHGDLASHSPGFSALQDLLDSGATSRLSTTPPSTVRGGAVRYRALPEPLLYPTKSFLETNMLGKTARKSYRQGERPRIRVTVVHGDLRYASYPIVVGHYEGDTIIGAEAQVDELMRGALRQRYALGIYPGEFGSVAVILQKPSAVQKALALPSRAIVIGLGKWGELSAERLSALLRRAAIEYVLEHRDNLEPAPEGQASEKIGVSVLLIGGNSATNIAIGDSIGAILRAIAQANRELAEGNAGASTIEEVEIIELYADTAIEAAHAVKRLAPLIGTELTTDIDAAPLLKRGRDGRRRLASTAGRDAWRRWEVSVVAPPRKAEPACLPKPLADRLKRAVLASDSADAELLAALAELAITGPAEPAEAHREIKFLTLGDRARAEVTSQQRQPELVERLIADSISKPHFGEEESRVLFELMVPNELKSGLAQVDNLVLVLDAECAAYPWELMSAGDKPLCIDKSLVRQLQTSKYRAQIGTRAGTAAYVVGDPKVGPPFGQLPGAAAEATTVYEQLRGRFDVAAPAKRPTALQVLSGLYAEPYRIVHLAGHGDYKPPATEGGKARSGMVLDNGVFLTAVEVGQMQQVPELVFLNCCHIGQTGPEATATPTVEFNRLAASISRELIEMGVRAVVAAGWAVDDAAAENFAQRFYEKMLGDETFGRALKAARIHTYQQFRGSNTWGAYQAYGDPDYRLNQPGTGTAPTGLGQVDVAEFIQAVENIGRRAEEGHTSTALSKEVEPLDALVRDCPIEWRDQTDVRMAIGFAYARLKKFDKASENLIETLAAEGDTSTTTMRAVEQLANYEARHAERIAADEPARAGELFECAILRLKQLLAVAKTTERHSLLGATYKRRAATEANPEAARAALAEASDHYRKAYLYKLERQGLDPYPTLNWLTLAALLGEDVPDADELLERCEAAARELFFADRKFFTAMGIADAELVRAFRSGRLCEDGQAGANEVARLENRFQEVNDLAGPTVSELDSVVNQIAVTGKLLGRIWPNRASTGVTVDRLDELRRRLAGVERSEPETDTPDPSGGDQPTRIPGGEDMSG